MPLSSESAVTEDRLGPGASVSEMDKVTDFCEAWDFFNAAVSPVKAVGLWRKQGLSVVLGDEPVECGLHVGRRLQLFGLQAFQPLQLLCWCRAYSCARACEWTPHRQSCCCGHEDTGSFPRKWSMSRLEGLSVRPAVAFSDCCLSLGFLVCQTRTRTCLASAVLFVICIVSMGRF